jgi:hypothetical protein
MDFAARGFIPPRFVLEFGDVPGADEILQKLDSMQQAAQQQGQEIGPDYQQKMQMLTQVQQ